MKIGVNSIEEFSKLKFAKSDYEELVSNIGSQLGAVDETTDWEAIYKGILIVRVISCIKHQNADSLNVCLIDDGGISKDVHRDSEGYIQVVCGAPNVREGMLAVWIPPGATVPATFGTKESFVLSSKELRGVISNGMLSSASELALSDDHSGLLEIDSETNATLPKPGDYFSKAFGMNDFVIDIENKMFTHRPDCFGVLGVAREISGIMGKSYESPEWYLSAPSFSKIDELPLKVTVEVPKLVTRFMAVALNNVSIAASPIWMQALLKRIGIKSINNVVDVTNYVMHVTGQPLHAYDYDKVAMNAANGAELIARYPKENEKIDLLNGKTISPRDEAVIIANHNGAIGVGGIMGGSTTEVSKHTKNIILEVATFDMYNIRRTSMHHGLFTDAVTRFSKGQSPHQNDRILSYAMNLLNKYSGAKQASSVVDVKGAVKGNKQIVITPEYINQRLGLELTPIKIEKILTNVEFIVAKDKANLLVTAPFWRTDIEIPEDIVEEVGRLNGFDKLPLILPTRSITPTVTNKLFELKAAIRNQLSRSGANEILSYSFVHGNLLEQTGQDVSKAFGLSNALSPQLQYYRLSLTPSLLEKVHPNAKAGFNEFAIFEIGKSHSTDFSDDGNGVPEEFQKLAFVYSAQAKAVTKGSGEAYYRSAYFLRALMESLHIQFELVPSTVVAAPFDKNRSADICIKGDGKIVGQIGEYNAQTIKFLKLSKFTSGFEIDLEMLLSHAKNSAEYMPLSRYPKITQDISLKVDASMSFKKLNDEVCKVIDEINKATQTQTVTEPLDIYVNEANEKHVAFRLTFISHFRTLKTEEISTYLDQIARELKQSLGADRI